MKLALNALVCCAILAGTAAASDFETLQGTWKLVAGIRDGNPVIGAQQRLTIEGNHFSFTDSPAVGTAGSGTFQLNESANPKTVDVSYTDGADQGKTALGIYEVRAGNRFRLCLASPGAARPSKLESKSGSGNLFQEWERTK